MQPGQCLTSSRLPNQRATRPASHPGTCSASTRPLSATIHHRARARDRHRRRTGARTHGHQRRRYPLRWLVRGHLRDTRGGSALASDHPADEVGGESHLTVRLQPARDAGRSREPRRGSQLRLGTLRVRGGDRVHVHVLEAPSRESLEIRRARGQPCARGKRRATHCSGGLSLPDGRDRRRARWKLDGLARPGAPLTNGEVQERDWITAVVGTTRWGPWIWSEPNFGGYSSRPRARRRRLRPSSTRPLLRAPIRTRGDALVARGDGLGPSATRASRQSSERRWLRGSCHG